MSRAFRGFHRVANTSGLSIPSVQTVAAAVAISVAVGGGAYGLLSYFFSPITLAITSADKQRVEDLTRQERTMQELRQQRHLDMTMLVGVMTSRSSTEKDIAALAALVERVAPSQPQTLPPKMTDKDVSSQTQASVEN